MQNLEKQVGQRLTHFYIIALSAVAILLLVEQVLVQRSLSESLNDAHVVNLAGRQRMLSQYICKTVLLLTHSQNSQLLQPIYYDDLKTALPLWKKTHEGLREGKLTDFNQEYEVKNSKPIRELFAQIDSIFLLIYSHALHVQRNIETRRIDAPKLNQGSVQTILAHEREFLRVMDRIVEQYDLEATKRVNRVKTIELLLFGLTLGVLLIEALLIFLPLTRYTLAVIKRLTDSETELISKNETLHQTNLKLAQSQTNLLKTTQEKYELIRQEDRVRSASLLQGQEQERERIARELHDGIGQMLTGLKLHSEKLKSLPFANDKQRKDFEYHQNLINETIQATRHISYNLMPVVLSDFGLVAVLKLLAEQTRQSTGIEVSINENLADQRLSYQTEINLYRIAQEAINNAIKHANTKNIDIALKRDKNYILLSITDFGKGFVLNKSPTGQFSNGLKNIYERVRLLHGAVNLDSKPNKGTCLSVKLEVE